MFFFHKFIRLSSPNIQVFRKSCAKFKSPPPKKKKKNISASWDLQMGINSAFKGLNAHCNTTILHTKLNLDSPYYLAGSGSVRGMLPLAVPQ
jgi:hypothetical protein